MLGTQVENLQDSRSCVSAIVSYRRLSAYTPRGFAEAKRYLLRGGDPIWLIYLWMWLAEDQHHVEMSGC